MSEKTTQLEQRTSDLVDDNQLENERAIEQYKAKIEQLDASIEEYRVNNVQAIKRQTMKQNNYSDEQIEKYIGFIECDNVEEIKQSVFKLTDNITPAIYHGDPSANNGRPSKPKTVNNAETIGQSMFDRIKGKVFPGR